MFCIFWHKSRWSERQWKPYRYKAKVWFQGERSINRTVSKLVYGRLTAKPFRLFLLPSWTFSFLFSLISVQRTLLITKPRRRWHNSLAVNNLPGLWWCLIQQSGCHFYSVCFKGATGPSQWKFLFFCSSLKVWLDVSCIFKCNVQLMLVIKILIKGIFLATEYSAIFFLNPVEVWLEENKQTKKLHIKVMILTSVKTSGDELTWLIVLIICWICIYSLINQTETTWLWLQLQPRQEVPLAQSRDGALNAVGS